MTCYFSFDRVDIYQFVNCIRSPYYLLDSMLSLLLINNNMRGHVRRVAREIFYECSNRTDIKTSV